MEAVVAAQVREPRIPADLVVLAAGHGRAQIVVDALARHPAQPVEGAGVALKERLEPQVEAEERRLRARERQRDDQRVDAPLPAGDPRPARHLGPVELHHLPRPIPGPLRRPHACGRNSRSRRLTWSTEPS